MGLEGGCSAGEGEGATVDRRAVSRGAEPGREVVVTELLDSEWVSITLIGWLLWTWVGVRSVRSALKAEELEANERECQNQVPPRRTK